MNLMASGSDIGRSGVFEFGELEAGSSRVTTHFKNCKRSVSPALPN